MFQQIMAKMSEVKMDLSRDIKELRTEKNTNSEKITKIEDTQVEQSRQIGCAVSSNLLLMDKFDQMADTIAHQGHLIKELNGKVEFLETERLRPNLIVKGIKEGPEENCKSLIKEFFKNQMSITEEIPIKKAHRIGKGKHRPILATLADPDLKAKIYASAAKLQDQKNYQDKPYRLDDQLPT